MKKEEDYFDDILNKFIPKILKALKIEFSLGSMIAITDALDKGKKTSINPLNLSKKDESALIDTMERLIKGANQDLSKKISNAINENITQRGGNKELAKSIKEIFDKDSPNYFDYKKRFETIARTESTRVLSLSSLNTAKKLGATGKYLLMVNDNRTSDISKALNKIYGTPEQAIPLDEEFKVTVRGKTYSGLTTPIHINDRDLLLYTFE